MKKIICILMLFALLFSSAAYAEEFTLYGDIHFGSTLDDYSKVAESIYQSPIEVFPHGATLGDISDAYGSCEIKTRGMRGIEIAGIKNSGVLYAFDENDQVYQCLYSLGIYRIENDSRPMLNHETYDKDTADSIYNALQKKLIQKYGIPESQYYKDETVYVLYSFADELGVPFTNCVEMANACENSVLQNIGCDQVSEWLVMQSNGDAVLIDCFIGYNVTSFSTERYYSTAILYTYIPADALNQQDETNDWL